MPLDCNHPAVGASNASAEFLLTFAAAAAYSAPVSRSMPPSEYRCPGQEYSISRSVHLGRLARFDARCRQCPHAADAALSPRQVRRWAEVLQRPGAGPRLDAEGLCGVWHNELHAELVGQYARALAAALWRARQPGRPCRVVVGGDGRPMTAAATAAALEAVRWTGCEALDAGPLSAPALALAIDHWQAAGALLIGNAPGRPNTASLKLWRGPAPLSAGHGLEAVQLAAGGHIDRPTRAYGALEHVSPAEVHLAGLTDQFHGLRPLRIVLASTCTPVASDFQRLAARVACQVIGARDPGRLGDQVREQSAHLGVAVEDDGEVCRVFDESGRPVPGERLLLLVAGHLLERQPGAAIVLAPGVPAFVAEELHSRGAQPKPGGATRAEMLAAMRRHEALLGGGAGRFWHHCGPTIPDALRTLAYLLRVLSRSDRPLSQVLDAAAPAN